MLQWSLQSTGSTLGGLQERFIPDKSSWSDEKVLCCLTSLACLTYLSLLLTKSRRRESRRMLKRQRRIAQIFIRLVAQYLLTENSYF